MATTAQIKRGLGSFISSEIMPNIPGGTLKRVAIGTVLDLFLDNMENAIGDEESILVSLLGIKETDGSIDIHRVAERIKSNMPEEGIKSDLKVMGIHLGNMTLYRHDIDSLVRHITSA